MRAHSSIKTLSFLSNIAVTMCYTSPTSPPLPTPPPPTPPPSSYYYNMLVCLDMPL
jgi:hypothetical protein